MAKGFLLGVVAALVAAAVVGALVVWSGVVDVAATPHGLQDRVLAYASTRSIRHHANDERNPLAKDPGALKIGLEHYRAMCVDCHGGPGAEPEEFAAGLHPRPPDLASPEVQSFTDGMLYDTVARGIGSTGMPAFGATHPPNELWSIVAFVRHLPSLTPEEKAQLGRKEEAEEGEHPGGAEHHEGGAAAGSHGSGDAEHGGGAASAAAPGARVHQVSIGGFKFAPPTLEVREGDVVEWKNDDFVAHTATADDKSFDTGRIDAGEVKRVTVKKKGRVPYFCRFHVEMKGAVVVE